MACIFCQHKKTYTLSNGYIKCASCKKKYSLKKIERQKKILLCFCQNISAKQASQQLSLNYITVSKTYKRIRVAIVSFLDQVYAQKNVQLSEYDEYIYSNSQDGLQVHNILTFNYDGFIYNLILPTTRNFNYEDRKALEHFTRQYRMRKLQHTNSLINQFWDFLEAELKRYKGFNQQSFILYLKECEFKFNYKDQNKEQLLQSLLHLL